MRMTLSLSQMSFQSGLAMRFLDASSKLTLNTLTTSKRICVRKSFGNDCDFFMLVFLGTLKLIVQGPTYVFT